MTDTASFTPQAAARALAEAATYEDALRQRTEGLTWMIWGIATPAIWLSYGFAGATFRGDWPVWAQFLWAPWVLAGVVTTVVLWRSAALAAPRIAENERPGWIVGLAWMAATAVMFYALHRGAGGLNAALIPLIAIGAVWTLFGAVNLHRCSSTGRRVSTGIGAATLAAAVALAYLVPGSAVDDYVVATVGSVLVTSVFPLAGGLWQTFRG